MVNTYEDFVAVLEIEIDRLRDAEEHLNEEGQQKLKVYRKIRTLTSFAESCQELIELGVIRELDQEEEKAAGQALGAIQRIAKAENMKDERKFTDQDFYRKFNDICERRCRFRDLKQESLEEKCEACPLNELGDMIGL